MKTKNGKKQMLSRRRRALAMLEAQYEKFRTAHEDKPSWTTNDGRIHKGSTYAEECSRFVNEINLLKERLRVA